MPDLARREDWFDSTDQNHLTPIIIWLASAGLLLIGILFLVVFLCKRRFKRQKATRERKELEAGMKKVLSFSERERRLTESIETSRVARGSMSASSLVLGAAESGAQEKVERVDMEGSGWQYGYSQPNHIHLPVHHTPDGTRPRDEYQTRRDGTNALPATGNRLSEPFEIVEVENHSSRSASVNTTSTINTVYRFHYPTPLTPPIRT